MNNVSRALVNRLTVKFAGEILQDTDGYDLFKLYEDLFLTEKERANRLSEGIQSEDLAKIRCNAGNKKTSGVDKEKKLNGIYGNKYRIPIDHEILKNHGVFFPRALSDELVFELRLAPASNVVKGSDATKLAYELTNIQLEYEVIHNKNLADEAESNYQNGKRLMYEHVTHHKTISFAKGTDSIINESINVPRRSMKGLLLLFYEGYAGGARDSEKTFNPDITEVKVVVNGIPNKIYSQGMKTRDFWEEIFRRFGKENSSLDATDFYTGNLRSLDLPFTEIARMLLVSRWTLRRLVMEYGLQDVTGYSPLTDEQLDNIVTQFMLTHGNLVGYCLMSGHLRSLGLRVQRDRIRASIARIDPENSRIRWAVVVSRRAIHCPYIWCRFLKISPITILPFWSLREMVVWI